MAEFVMNIVLILAVLVLLVALLIGATRRRHRERRQRADERRLILCALLGTAAGPTEAAPESPQATGEVVSVTASQPLDAASIAGLLDLIEDRRPTRRGLFAGLVDGSRGVWNAGARAGQHVGHRSMGQRAEGIQEAGPRLYRAAAREVLDIHAHDPVAALLEYRRYADALGDPALAELYVRAAAHATYDDTDQVRLAVEQITGAPGTSRPGAPNGTPTISA